MRTIILLFVSAAVLAGPMMAQTPADTSKKAETPPAAGAATQSPEVSTVKSSLNISKDTFCTGVQEREPVGEAEEFPATVGKLYFWTNIENTDGESSITHVWYLNDKEMARVELPIKYSRNRVWSTKTIPSDATGTWKIEVLAADGSMLGEKTCTVK